MEGSTTHPPDPTKQLLDHLQQQCCVQNYASQARIYMIVIIHPLIRLYCVTFVILWQLLNHVQIDQVKRNYGQDYYCQFITYMVCNTYLRSSIVVHFKIIFKEVKFKQSIKKTQRWHIKYKMTYFQWKMKVQLAELNEAKSTHMPVLALHCKRKLNVSFEL